MALIDLTRQAQASSTARQVLRVSNTLNSDTGFYDVIWDTFDFADIGTGSFDAGLTGILQAKSMYLYDEGTGGNLYTTGSYGEKLILQLNPEGYMTGSVKIIGDLIVEGSQSVANTATMRVEDPIIDVNFSGSTALSSTDAGLRVGRAGSTNAQLVFDHSETRWALDNAAGSNINIVGVSTTDTLTNKTITGLATSTMASAGNLTFSGTGEVLGLPATASANGAATSKLYVDHRNEFLRKSYVKKAASFAGSSTLNEITGYQTASFTAATASAPSGLTSVGENDFVFFLNGQYMEHDALEVQQSGSNFLLKVNTTSIGYVLESDDEIIAHGKFNS
jgi:hypothetical protein